ncbi:MAG: hypothetical protein K5634_06650 [Sphaerochaetaceae bacterium]|nr:hypothetical protein [Sphaerochaetaceae bacterium]
MKQFDLFILALRDFEKMDSVLYGWPRNRFSLSHALAVRLMNVIKEKGAGYDVDLISPSKKNPGPDILVHDRVRGRKYLEIRCRNDYLSEEEQNELLALSEQGRQTLYLGLSFFPQKNYMLIYSARSGKIGYMHFSRNTLTAEAVRTKTLKTENFSQPVLKI